MSLRRRLPALLAAVVAAALAATALAAPASAGPPDRTPAASGGALYLALGDSVAAGIGAAPENGYVDQLGRLLTGPGCVRLKAVCRIKTRNLSVSGATTQDLIDAQLPAALKLLAQRNGNASAADDVRLITITIGGNDVFGPVINACTAGDPALCVATINQQLALVLANYTRILDDLAAASGPRTTIAVMTYYNSLVPSCGFADIPGLSALAAGVLEGLPFVQQSLNGVIRTAARGVGAVSVDTLNIVGSDELVGDCLHPNDLGHTAIADVFAQALSGPR